VPNVIKEAMGVGTPIVGSDIAGIPELLANGTHGMIVPRKNVNALCNAIETLLANERLRHDFALGARRYAEDKFDLWRNGRRLAEIFSSTPPRRERRFA
jgi:glycosyltransferase involved in cell wall biosynthesis